MAPKVCLALNIAERLQHGHKIAIIHPESIDETVFMALFITELQGCTDLMAARLAEAGIIDSAQLLQACATRAQRHALAAHAEVDESLILALANRADLARIRGVAGVYADLMERAGVDTVRELAQRRADHLFEKLTAVNQAEAITQAPPTLKQVEKWIDQAKKLSPVLTY